MSYLNIKHKKPASRNDGRLIHHHNDLLRTASQNIENERRLNQYRDKHELDLTDPQEPDDYDKALTADPAYKEFIDTVNKTPF